MKSNTNTELTNGPVNEICSQNMGAVPPSLIFVSLKEKSNLKGQIRPNLYSSWSPLVWTGLSSLYHKHLIAPQRLIWKRHITSCTSFWGHLLKLQYTILENWDCWDSFAGRRYGVGGTKCRCWWPAHIKTNTRANVTSFSSYEAISLYPLHLYLANSCFIDV